MPRVLLVLLLGLLVACGRPSQAPPAGPLPPAEAVRSFRLSDDFRIELFAAEPDVVDPVEVVFDENGRAFVAEMLDYPDDPPAGKPPRSRIRMLEDTNDDGRADRSVLFAEGLLQVAGMLPWKGGLIVPSAPDILYLKDTDGDGRADYRKVLFTGFAKVNPEGRISNPRLAIDNWIYFANNGANGRITSPDHPERPPLLVRGADFRYHPLRDLAETASGVAQYGLTFDDWGNRFITQNTIHLRHVVVPMNYLARAPLLPAPAVSWDISDHGRPAVRMYPLTAPQHWRQVRTQLRQKRFDENKLNRTEYLAGYITAAAGSTVYTGDVFPERYGGAVFTGDVSGNLIHLDRLTADGVTFSASRDRDGVEFLASTDQWFRPCSFANAPDGLLYVADIYREFIETPESIPDELKKKMNFWSGDTLGRIWRIVPNQPRQRRNLRPNLGAATTAALVRELENTNGWHRATAQRLLIERQDRSAAAALKELAASSRFPQARLHALWTLEGVGALDEPSALRALSDEHPRLREHGVRLSESLPQTAALGETLLARRSDTDLRVRYQLAFTLGGWKDARATEALAGLAVAHAADPWFRAAILSSTADTPVAFFELLLSKPVSWQHEEFLRSMGSLIGARQSPPEVGRFLTGVARLAKPEGALDGLARGLRLAGTANLQVPGADAALERFLGHSSEDVQKAAWEVARFLELRDLLRRAADAALSGSLAVARRVAAVGAMRGGRWSEAAPVLRKILESNPAPALQMAAIDAISSFDDPAVGETLLARWASYSPDGRTRAIAALLAQKQRIPRLVAALEQGQVPLAALDIGGRNRLLELPDPALAARARKLFAGAGGDRARLVESYRDALRLAGDLGRGKLLFEEHCARCHLPRRQGSRVGPDLSGISMKTREELLASLLDPSAAVEARFVNYLVTTRSGRLYDGILINETPGAITLRGGEEDVTLLRRNIAEIRASSISLMPEELEKSITRQGLADVIHYLRGGL